MVMEQAELELLLLLAAAGQGQGRAWPWLAEARPPAATGRSQVDPEAGRQRPCRLLEEGRDLGLE